MILNAIKEKFFDKGLRQHLFDKYETIGKIMGEQNGQYLLLALKDYMRFKGVYSASFSYVMKI